MKAPALALLAQVLRPIAEDIRLAFHQDPHNWSSGQDHTFWQVATRNLLHDRGFTAEYFGVSRLEEIHIALVEDALHLHIN